MDNHFQKDEDDYKKISGNYLKFNYKIFTLIIGLAIAYVIYIQYYEETDYLQLPGLSFVLGAFVCGVMSLIVGRKFKEHLVFRTSYIALGFSFLLLVVGQITYLYYLQVLEIDAYPSMADIFFLTYAPFACIHLVMNINYFKTKISTKLKILLLILGSSIVTLHTIIALDHNMDESSIDFIIATLYAIEYAILFPLAILGIIVARKTALGVAWLLLVIGLFVLGFADLWYTFVEFYQAFDFRHPINTVWLLAYMIITFALVKHLGAYSKKK